MSEGDPLTVSATAKQHCIELTQAFCETTTCNFGHMQHQRNWNKCLINSKEWLSWKDRLEFAQYFYWFIYFERNMINMLIKRLFISKANAKCLWTGQSLREFLLNVIDGWETVFNFLLKISYWAGLDGSVLKLIFQLKAHWVIFAKSLLSSKELSGIMENREKGRVICKQFAICWQVIW